MLTPIRPELIHNRLTTAERVYLFRVRAGLTQTEIAKKYGMTKLEWRMYETAHPKSSHPPKTIIMKGTPTKPELMAIWRRRHGIPIDEMAIEMGIAHITLNKRESGAGDWEETYNWWMEKANGRDKQRVGT